MFKHISDLPQHQLDQPVRNIIIQELQINIKTLLKSYQKAMPL